MAVIPHQYIYATASGVAESFKLPERKIDPLGDWDQTWGVFCIRHADRTPFRSGSLRIRRQAGKDGKALLIIDFKKMAAKGIINRTQAEVECLVDSLGTPVTWTTRYFTEDETGMVIGDDLKGKGTCKQDNINLADSSGSRSKKVSGDRTTFWTLFDAVQRLPKNDFEPLRFTFLDDLDQVIPGHTLSFRKAENLHLKQEGAAEHVEVPTRIYGYDQLGPAFLPMTYWVAEDGRLLFVLAGIDTFVLESEKGGKTNER